MASSPISTEVVRFGQCEANLRSRELRRDGASLRLPDQSFEVLVMLLERPGELVTREEIHKRLWAANTFVDFDHGLNNAVKRLRDALGDSAQAPCFVETLPRRGYRFIGRIEGSESSAGMLAQSTPADALPGVKPTSNWRITYHAAAILAFLCVVLAAFFVKAQRSRHPAIQSLAVLPFQNLSGDQSQEYFADGMTDELITIMAHNPGLRVISRTSVMQYKNVHRPLPEIARELGVDGILEGSVGRSSGRVHVTAQLIYAPGDSHIWAESYDRDLSDVSSLQYELAQSIARQVGLTASASSKRGKPINPNAHDAYLMGRYYWFSGDYDKSGEYFQKAISLQPDYAAAWSGVADSYIGAAVSGFSPAEKAISSGEPAAQKAMVLDDSVAEAHLTMAAVYYFLRWDWQGAERESRRAIELNPQLAEAHHLRGYILETLNRRDEALQETKLAMEIDPFSRPEALALALIHARKFDDAVSEARMRSEAQPDKASLHAILSDAYRHKRAEKEAAEQTEAEFQQSGDKDAAFAVHQAFNRGGFQAVREWQLSEYKKEAAKHYVAPLDFAAIYAGLNRKDEALHYLEMAYREHAPWLVHIQDMPSFDLLHSEPRYQAIVKKMGLVPAS